MKLAIIGGRDYQDYDRLCKIMALIKTPIELIISGGAHGADSLGARWADENGVEKLIFLPDWDRHVKRAGFLRNKDIINAADGVLAFWDGISKGTKSSIDLANKKGIPVKVINY